MFTVGDMQMKKCHLSQSFDNRLFKLLRTKADIVMHLVNNGFVSKMDISLLKQTNRSIVVFICLLSFLQMSIVSF